MERVDVSILGREYSLACLPAEKEALLAAVRVVDQRMLAIKNSGKVSGNERIAVMAAIHVAGEMLGMRAPDGPLADVAVGDLKRKIEDMHSILDQVVGVPGQSR